jgi:PKD repeat protein
MKQVSLWVGVVVSLALFFIISTACAQNSKLNDPEIARKLGLSVQQVHNLRAAFQLDDDGLLNLSAAQIQELVRDLEHPGIEKHIRDEDFRVLRMMDEHGKIPPDGLMQALEHRKHVGGDEDLFPVAPDPSTNVPTSGTPDPLAAGLQTNGWTWLGPGNIGGRVRSILIHPTATNTMWCGGVDGGVWKTTNSAASWFPLNDFMANLAVSCMVMDPADPNTIYAGTGEPTYNADAIRGAGIFKTTNGGATWFQLSATANSSYLYVSRLSIDPNNSQIMLAATRSGIFRTVNGGTNWTQPSSTEMNDVDFHPTDSSLAIASGRAGNAFYSTNGGLTWFAATGLTGARVEVAYCRSSPNVVYASVDNSSGQLYSSSDGGHTYALRNTGNNFLSAQGWYDNALWTDPTTTNIVIVGGLDTWRSTDGGATLTKISQWFSAPNSAHADHHFIVNHPGFDGVNIRTVYFCNDGGVYRANNVYSVSLTSGWQELNNNLGITQFYGGAGNTNSGVIVGGTQDNGDLRYTPAGGTEGWIAWNGGDGGFSASDRTDQNYFYGEYVYLQIHRSANGAASGSDIYSGIPDAGTAANFIAPFILDPNSPSVLLAGGSNLWRTANAKASPPIWTNIKAGTNTTSYISAIAVAPGNSDIIWVGHNNGNVYSTTNGTAASPTWTSRTTGLPGRFCSRIAITPGNPNSVYATFGGYNSGNVWRTINGGASWINITANLPAAPVNSIVIAPADTNTLYIGTDVGVFGTSDNGAHWSTGNDGPANVAVDELFWMGPKLIAVTHGRGMFSITPLIGGVNLVANGASISGGNGNASIDPNECNVVNLAIQNVGATAAGNLTATLTSSTPGVLIAQGTSAYPNLSNGVSALNTTPFQISTAPSFPCGTAVALSLNVAWTGGSNALTYTLPSGGTNYTLTPSSGAAIVPGVTDIGNHGDDVTTSVSLPFPVAFYGQVYNALFVDSNGRISFPAASSIYQNVCLPSGNVGTIMPLWDDLRTDASGSGIFVSTNGIAPNRIFNIEWRATYYSSALSASFEVRFYEGQARFDLVYGVLNDTGTSATVGIENTSSSFIQFECSSGGLSNGLQLAFQQTCTDGGGQCAAPPPVAAFSGTPTSGSAPLVVTFTNTSTFATNFSWDFGDGSFSANTNAVETYTNAGLYTVALTAVGPSGTNTITKTNYIQVTNIPPVITAQPQNQSVSQGGTASFSVTATGTLPLSYQWKHNGTNVPDASASTFTLTNAQFADGGTYLVMVTNVAGTIPSSQATLSVVYLLGFISITGDPWTETFDEMGSGTNTPPGWYVGTGTAEISSNIVAVSTGSSSLTRNYNFGTNGGADRALGAVGGSSVLRDTEARFVNVSGMFISAFNVSYTGEQWRFGGAGAVANTLSMQYSTDGTNFSNMGSQFNFTSPTLSSFVVALDGNDPTNRVTSIGGSYVPAASITNGQPFYLRWADPDETGPDMGLAIDDLTLTFTLSVPPPPVVAGFAASPTNGLAPLSVVFTNLSSGATNYLWDFGDGSVSALANPTNTYTNAGVYSVTLAAIGAAGTNNLTRTNYITVTNTPPPPVVADFAADPTNGPAPLTVVFTNLSTGATNYLWDFGDGNFSTAANPTNSYTNAGIYSVALAAIGAAGTNIITRTNYITVTNAPPPQVIAGFAAVPTNGAAPLTVVFTNLSAGATNYLWDLGDGNFSAAVNPTNSYTNSGIYSVTLTAVGVGGTNLVTRTNYITVTNTPPPPVVADFAGSPTNGIVPLSVAFTNLSSGATNYLWDFGDGNLSGLTSPTNSYTNAGTYSVTLTATGPAGTNVLTKTNYILVTLPGVLVVLPASFDFGLLATGTTAQTSLLVSNAGPGTLTGSAVLSGVGPFTIGSGTPFSLTASGSTNLVVNFAPTNSGSFTNLVLFATDAGIATNAISGRALYAPIIFPAPSAQAEFDFSFETFSGFNYTVQYKDFLTDPLWQTLQTLPGDGSTKFITNSVAAPDQRLYRLLVQ